MLTYLKAEIPAASDYEDEQVKLHASKAALTLPLFGGIHKAHVQVPIGIYKPAGETVVARLEISYRTDIPGSCIQICGSEAVPGLTAAAVWHCPQKEIQSLSLYSKQPEPLARSLPRLAVMQDSLQAMCEGVREAALRAGISVMWKQDLGPYKDRYFVLQDGCISHIFDPEYEDFDACDTKPISSYYDSSVVLSAGTKMTNVINSSGDRYPGYQIGNHELRAGGSWIKFWSFMHTNGTDDSQKPPCCYVQQHKTYGHICNSPAGGKWTYGAHSLKVYDGINRNIPHGVQGSSDVFILPACNRANSIPEGIFVVQNPTFAVKLKDYYMW